MKTKWQVWAHLLCTNYSITALKKITKWLRTKDIIDLDWVYVCSDNSHKWKKRNMTYFMAWYKDESPTCATYPQLSRQIELQYNYEMFKFYRTIAHGIQKKYENDDFDIRIPF